MKQILPLTEEQLKTLPQETSAKNRPFRLLANGQAVNLTTGVCAQKGSNIMYHLVYWDRPKAFIKLVLQYMRKNNPKIRFRVTYH